MKCPLQALSVLFMLYFIQVRRYLLSSHQSNIQRSADAYVIYFHTVRTAVLDDPSPTSSEWKRICR